MCGVCGVCDVCVVCVWCVFVCGVCGVCDVCGVCVCYCVVWSLLACDVLSLFFPTVGDWSRGDSRLLTADGHKNVALCQLTVTRLFSVSADSHKTASGYLHPLL